MAAAACAAIAGTGPARASGFALREGSTDWMANAFAGDAAKAYDAATVWSNPAGMVRLNQNEIDGAINGIFPTIHFSGANFVARGVTTPGSTGNNLIEAAATGGAFGVWNFLPDLKFGIGATAPFGQRVDNPQDFVGRYQSLVSSISDISVVLAASYRINDQWSIGGGPVIDNFYARLTQAINTGPTAALTGDPVADVHGDSTSVGANVGVLFQPNANLRFGLDYRSRIQHSITGSQSIFVPPLITAFSPQTAALLAAQNSQARTTITLPDIVTGSASWQVLPQLTLLATVEFTAWSVLNAVHISPTNPYLPGTTIQENWRNTWFGSVGANYRVTDQLMLQGGVGLDESPVTDCNRTTRIPDSNRVLLNVGAQYDILPNVTLQAAYGHVFFASAPINNAASATSGLIVGKYSSSADTASLGVKVRF